MNQSFQNIPNCFVHNFANTICTYVHMYPLVCLLCQNHSAFFNSQPVKPPPLSWQQENGHRYLDNQDFSKLSTTCSDILLSILINSARSVTLSIYNSHNREFICSLSTSVCSHIQLADGQNLYVQSILYLWQASQ